MSELLDIATRAGWANDGEQVEAFVVHETETEFAYEGEVESFTRASSGCRCSGHRRRQAGLRYAGTLDDTALQETLREARDNASFAEPDEFNGLAVPDGVEPASLELWSDTVGAFPTEDKIARRSSSSGRRSQPKPGSRVSSRPNTSTLRTSRGCHLDGYRRCGRETGCYVSVYTLAEADGDPDRFRVLDRPPE